MNEGSAGRAASRATLLVTRRCDNACVFCAQPNETPTADAESSLRSMRATTDEVTFVGGEPTLEPELPALVAIARDVGYRRIGLQTNARMLGRGGLAGRLAAAGLTDVHGTLLGADASVHDYHTGRAGSFVESMAGLGAARAAGVTVVVSAVVTRSNCRNLDTLPALLGSRGVSALHFAVPLARGRAAEAFDRVVPRLGIALPFVLHAVDRAQRLGQHARISGAPLCMLGPFASANLPTDVNGERAYASVCEDCEARKACPGVDPAYLARFGGDELAPRKHPTSSARRPEDRLFTGPVELGDGPVGPIPEPPRAARRHLPVLARPSPGLAERRNVPAQSGDALRAILPALFEPEERS